MYGEDFQSSFNRLVWWLLKATRGGDMRTKIMKSIMDEPKNANRIRRELGVNYRTIEHHLKVLADNTLVMSQGDRYGKIYFLSPSASKNLDIFQRIFDEVSTEDGKR